MTSTSSFITPDVLHQLFKEAGYEREGSKWIQKDSPTVGDVHTNKPIGAIKPKEQGKKKSKDIEDEIGVTGLEVTKRISGSSNISLNVKGQKLAENLGKRIALKGGLDVIHSSPLPRATETADAIVAANPNTKRADPTSNLQPWHLGDIEGRQPDEVHNLIDHYLEHPDEVPSGTGNDDEPGESFNDAKTRQLDCLNAINQDSIDHPNLKIGVVMHSRGMELLQSWIDAGMPDDYELDLKDLDNPDDPDHADMLRWHNDKIKEVDLDSDDELKPGVYPILHSLTDDDTDEGNEDLEKQEEPPNLRVATNKECCGTCGYFDQTKETCQMFGGYPVKSEQVCDEYVEGEPGTMTAAIKYDPNQSRGDNGEWSSEDSAPLRRNKDQHQLLLWAVHPTQGPVSVDSKHANIVSHSDWFHNLGLATSVQHNVQRGVANVDHSTGEVLLSATDSTNKFPPNSVVNHLKSKYGLHNYEFKDVNYGRTREDDLNKYDPNETRDESGKWSQGSWTPSTAAKSMIRRMQIAHDALKNHKGREYQSNASAQNHFRKQVEDLGFQLHKFIDHYSMESKVLRSQSVRVAIQRADDALNRPSDDLLSEHVPDFALSWYHDAITQISRSAGDKTWVGKALRYLPPIEVQRDAQRAYDNGMAVIDVTAPMCEGDGLDETGIRKIAEHFESTESSTDTPLVSCAWGGKYAKKWANRVIRKIDLEKFNPDHDNKGRFSSGSSTGVIRTDGWMKTDGTFHENDSHEGHGDSAVRLGLAKGDRWGAWEPAIKAGHVRVNVSYHASLNAHQWNESTRKLALKTVGRLPDSFEGNVSIEIESGREKGWRVFNDREEAIRFLSISPSHWDGAAFEIAAARSRLNSRDLNKYDVNQPRDSKGEWASGEGDLADLQRLHDNIKHHPARNPVHSESATSNYHKQLIELHNRVGSYSSKAKLTSFARKEAQTALQRANDHISHIDSGGEIDRADHALANIHHAIEIVTYGVSKIDESELVLKAGNGIMISFHLDLDTAKKLAIPNGEKPEQMHITLAYLGRIANYDPQLNPQLEALVQTFAMTHAPLTVELGGPTRFNATEHSDGKDVVVASVQSKEIHDYRDDLVDALDSSGLGKIRYPRDSTLESMGFAAHEDFAYTPHVTLAYIEPDAEMPIDRVDSIEVTFNKITLNIGGDSKDYELTGGDRFEINGDIVKLDKDQHLVFGWFSITQVNGKNIKDTQEDIIKPDMLESTAYEFVLNARKGGHMHQQEDGVVKGVGRLVESVVFTKEKQEAMLKSLHDQGINDAVLSLPVVAWWGGMKISDPDVWKKVTTGELRAWSIGGKGKRMSSNDSDL